MANSHGRNNQSVYPEVIITFRNVDMVNCRTIQIKYLDPSHNL